MSKVFLGLIAGIVFGALDVALMLPMSCPIRGQRCLAHLPAASPLVSLSVVFSCRAGPVGSLAQCLAYLSAFRTRLSLISMFPFLFWVASAA